MPTFARRVPRRVFAHFARWSAAQKLAVSLGLVLVAASSAGVYAVTRELRAQALRHATIMAEQALNRNVAIHAYFDGPLADSVVPLGEAVHGPGFFDPRWTASYAVREFEEAFRKASDEAGIPLRTYREVAIGARDPRNEADPDEREFLLRAAADPSLVTESSVREIDGRKYLVVMRRGATMEQGCLRCHGDPAQAPQALLERYGPSRSFGYHEGDLASAMAVRVPLDVAYAEAAEFTRRVSLVLLPVLLGALGIQFALQHRWVLRPVRSLAATARAVARMPATAPQAPLPMSRELRTLTRIFNAMARFVARRDEYLERKVKERTEALAAAHAQLAMADRLASLGTLAAGMAHEVNNPLAYVRTNLSFLDERLAALPPGPGVEELRAAARDAEHGVMRAGTIISAMMRFAHPLGSAAPVAIDVREELFAAVKLSGHRVRSAGRLELDVPERLPSVRGRERELSQVFVNLLANAADALPPDRVERNVIRVRAHATEREVTVEVADNGTGIAPELLPRIFDPFVTTKEVGRGTGLGLSVCHGIVTSMGGRIEVESAPGDETRFRVVLPVA